MKITRAEFLVAVAIVSSAAVLQIREYMSADAAVPAVPIECGSEKSGLMPAACGEPTRGEKERGALPRRAEVRVWV